LLPDRSAAAEQAAANRDPITTLVEKLSASHAWQSGWQNGMYPTLGLPATASTDEVIARVFEMTSFQEGRAYAAARASVPGAALSSRNGTGNWIGKDSKGDDIDLASAVNESLDKHASVKGDGPPARRTPHQSRGGCANSLET
jgi:hypothetical protein